MSSARIQKTRSIYKKLFFYTLVMNNPKMKLRKQFHLFNTIASKRIKYLGYFDKRSVKLQLWTLQNTVEKKKIKEDLNKWEDIPCSWTDDLTVKMAISPNWFTDSMQSPSKFQLASFEKLTNWSYNSYGNVRDPESWNNLEKERKLKDSLQFQNFQEELQ